MRRTTGIVSGLALFLFLPAATRAAEGQEAPKIDMTSASVKASYALGFWLGADLKEAPDVDIDILVRGLQDGFAGRKSVLSPEEAETVAQDFLRQLQAQRTQKNLKEGQAFLAENKKKKDVVTTESGLQYVVLKEGEGPKPKPTDRVRVHYRGTLIDGTEFDSSYKRGEPAVFPVRGVIAGWTEALQLMNVGSKYRLFIPSNLAYGPQGRGRVIGPNTTLIFETELLGIEEAPEQPAPGPQPRR